MNRSHSTVFYRFIKSLNSTHAKHVGFFELVHVIFSTLPQRLYGRLLTCSYGEVIAKFSRLDGVLTILLSMVLLWCALQAEAPL